MGFLLSLLFIIGCVIVSKLLGEIIYFLFGWMGRLFVFLSTFALLFFLKEIHSILLGAFLIINIIGLLSALYECDFSSAPLLKRKIYKRKAFSGMYSGLVLFACSWTLFSLGKSIQYLDFLTRGWQIFSGIILLLAGWCVAILGLDDSDYKVKGQFACPMQVESGGNVVLYEKNKFNNLSEFYDFAAKKNLKEIRILCTFPDDIEKKFEKLNNDYADFNAASSNVKEANNILNKFKENYKLLDAFYDKILDIVQKNLGIKKDDAFRDVDFSRIITGEAKNSSLLFLGGDGKTLVYAISPSEIDAVIIVVQGEKATEDFYQKLEEKITELKYNYSEHSEFTFETFTEEDYNDETLKKIKAVKQNDGIWFKENAAKLSEKYNLKRNARQGIIDTAYIIKYDWLGKWTNAISFSIPSNEWLDFSSLSMKFYNKFLRLSKEIGGCLKVRDDAFGVPCCALICAEDVAVAYGTGKLGEKMIMWQTRLPNQSKIVELCIKKHLTDSFVGISFVAENIQLHSNQNGFELNEQKFIDKFLIEIDEENGTQIIEDDKNSSENIEKQKLGKIDSPKKNDKKNTNPDASLKKLEKIHSMFEKGLITKEEFEKKKMELLADI